MSKKLFLGLFAMMNFVIAPLNNTKPYTLSIPTEPLWVGDTEDLPKGKILKGSTLYINFYPFRQETKYPADQDVCLKSMPNEIELQPSGYKLHFAIKVIQDTNSSHIFRMFNKAMQEIRDRIIAKAVKKFGDIDELFHKFVSEDEQGYDFHTYRIKYEMAINWVLNNINEYMTLELPRKQRMWKIVQIGPGSYWSYLEYDCIVPDIFDTMRAACDSYNDRDDSELESDVIGLDVSYQSESESDY